jgi:hypothetical protein
MRFSLPLFFPALVLFILSSCKPMPNDGIPFYLRIDSVKVAGSATHHISDVWVEANAANLGAYELPCNFPVLQEGDVGFVINAGIEESGQSGVRVTYPFYSPDTFTLHAARGEKYERAPMFRYKPAVTFVKPEDFEASNSFNSNMGVVSDSNVRYGLRCGVISATTDSSKETAQLDKYDLPEGKEIWLELDYKNEVPFYIGIYGNYGSGSVIRVPVLFVTAKPSWNKIYVKLSSTVGGIAAATYNIYFEALRPYGLGGGSVYIDNVRMVYL